MINIKVAVIFLFLCGLAFAQGSPKLTVNVVGTKDDGINKALENKLLIALLQSGKYAEVQDSAVADFVCTVSLVSVFDSYSISARMMEAANSQIVGIGSIDSPLSSLDDLTKVSNELAGQLLKTTASQLPPSEPAVPVVSPEKKECMDKLISGIQNDIPSYLQDCSVELGKNIAMSKVPFKKVPPEDIDPKKFMPKCVLNEIKEKYPVAEKFADDIEKFLQTALNVAASAGGVPDMPKLLSAVSDIEALLKSIEKISASVDEDELCKKGTPRVKKDDGDEGGGSEEKGFFSLGFRVGVNSSHVYEVYERGNGSSKGAGLFEGRPQVGLVFDFALSDLFHLQPGIMFINKKAGYGSELNLFYIEFPLLASFKFSAFRFNVGPYYSIGGIIYDGNYGIYHEKNDYGFSLGGGFDIWNFYIGVFYDYGWADLSKGNYFSVYNRTLGFNLGYNL